MDLLAELPTSAHISCFQASTSSGTDLEQSHLAQELLF